MSKILIPIILLSLFLRLYGINWDQGFHLHPDERFLTMVGNAMRFNNYFDTKTSLLNPHNIGFDFYVYGTWPVHLTKIIATLFSMDNYDNLILAGRFLSTIFDIGTVVLVFLIAKSIFGNRLTATLSALFYTLAVLPIQLSHFFAVDTFLVFFLTLSFYLLIKKSHPVLLGTAFGLAVAAKISAILFLPIILVEYVTVSLRGALATKQSLVRSPRLLRSLAMTLVMLFVSLLVSVRVFYPYLFDGLSLNQKVINNWKTLKSFDVPGYFPPAVQWTNTTPYIFPLMNTVFFGLGLPLGIIFILTLLNSIKIIRKYPLTGLLYIWIIGLFVYQGGQFAKPLRYLYPIYPAICMLTGYQIAKSKNKILVISAVLIVGLWTWGFMSIYRYPHSRVQASDWILENIPVGSKISCEYWDDCLPLINYHLYKTIQIAPYDKNKLPDISNIDYLIFSSNRLYGSIPSDPKLYPKTSIFYHELFNEKLRFEKVAEFSSRPNWPIPGINLCLIPPFFNYGFVSKNDQYCTQVGISFVDDYADETLTVYDHPKVLIFKRNNL